MELQTIFKRLGFPKHTENVYVVLGKSKTPLLVATIAERAHVSRAVVYRCLKKLQREELIGASTIGRRTCYSAGSPRKLKSAIKIFQDKSEKGIETYAKEREKETPQNIRFLYGPIGIRSAFDDVITHTSKGDTFYRYTSERDLERVNRYLASDYRTRRDKKRLDRLVISNPISGNQKKFRLERFIKFIPPGVDRFEHNIIQLIYGNRVAIIDLSNEQTVIIENQQLADFQKVIFKLLYKRL
jgi:sugar-specific transcriptional regulator TrmB